MIRRVAVQEAGVSLGIVGHQLSVPQKYPYIIELSYWGIKEVLNFTTIMPRCVRQCVLTHFCPPLRLTFAVRETDVSLHNGGTAGAPLKPL